LKKVLIIDDLKELKKSIGRLNNSEPGTFSEVIDYFPDRQNRILNFFD
jgi:hypothetical protein